MEPYRRSDYNRALIANALLSPFNVVLLAAMLIAGMVIGAFLLVLPVALVVYGIAATRTYLDSDEATRVLERERGRRRRALEKARLDPRLLAEPIRRLMETGLQREARIRDAIDRAELPYSEVTDETDRFIRAMEVTAQRAQLLWEALSESHPTTVEQRLQQVRGQPGKEELVAALENQLTVLRRMEGQLDRFFTQMERILVELDTVRGSLVSVSASSDAANQEQLAADVRGLREEVGALAEGMSEAYETPNP